jgi:hypothetical protein
MANLQHYDKQIELLVRLFWSRRVPPLVTFPVQYTLSSICITGDAWHLSQEKSHQHFNLLIVVQ